MRVIAGIFRGRVLSAPLGLITRPTSDRVKEALFNVLTSNIDFNNLSVIDICAGTGSLGIESLSRGAGSCCFIESNRAVANILNKNLLNTNCLDNSQLMILDAKKALRTLAERQQKFDLAFFDPPYSSDLYQYIPEMLDNINILSNGAILVAECSSRNLLAESFGRLKRFDRRLYGETALELFVLEDN